MANIEFKVYDCLCTPRLFNINGKEADIYDFGRKSDICPELDSDGRGCGNMQFLSFESHSEQGMEAIKKYNLTIEEYQKVCEMLRSGLSFGSCGLCI